jgi:hypothetical protein
MKKEGSMDMRLRGLLVAWAVAATTAAWGQTAAPAVAPTDAGAPSAAAQSSASIPDFSGLWSHPALNGLELPLSGPGPVRNRSRERTGPQAGVGDRTQLVGDYTNPILKPWAAEVVKKFGDISLAGKGYPTPKPGTNIFCLMRDAEPLSAYGN